MKKIFRRLLREKKKKVYCKRNRCLYIFGMNKDTFFCEYCSNRLKTDL